MQSHAVRVVLLFVAVACSLQRTTHSRPLDHLSEENAPHIRRRRASDLGDLTPGASGILNEGHVPLPSCKEVQDEGFTTSGLYKIDPADGEGEFTVFCDLTLLNGGWTVIQRRIDGTTSFEREWKPYRNGFGDLTKNFWLGLNKIKRITDMGSYELYIGLEDHASPTDTAWAKFGSFSLGSEASNYPITIGQFDSTSTAGDSLATHNGEAFSTSDQDNDSHTTDHCAQTYKGGWWYKDCHDSNLNGVWYTDGILADPQVPDGIIWQHWTGDSESLQTVVIAVRLK